MTKAISWSIGFFLSTLFQAYIGLLKDENAFRIKIMMNKLAIKVFAGWDFKNLLCE